MKDFLSSSIWAGVSAITGILAILLTLRHTSFPKLGGGLFHKVLSRNLMLAGVATIVSVLALLVALSPALAILSPKPRMEPHTYLSPTAIKAVPTSTQTVVVSSTPRQVPSVVPTSVPTVIPSSSRTVVITVQQTMQQFCMFVSNGDGNNAFNLLTKYAQQQDYQGDIQKFWGDFEEFSNGQGGACSVVSCSTTSCDVALSSVQHLSCRDRFTFSEVDYSSWHIFDWTSLNNSCGD